MSLWQRKTPKKMKSNLPIMVIKTRFVLFLISPEKLPFSLSYEAHDFKLEKQLKTTSRLQKKQEQIWKPYRNIYTAGVCSRIFDFEK